MDGSFVLTKAKPVTTFTSNTKQKNDSDVVCQQGLEMKHKTAGRRRLIRAKRRRIKYLDGEGALGAVGLQVDLHLSRLPACCHQLVPQLLHSVAAVGDQLPDEDLEETEELTRG